MSDVIGSSRLRRNGGLWCLAHQPEFEGVKFANAVDVPANETKERGVDLVPIRPGDYRDQRGFAAYLRDFNQLILDARNRRTRSYLAMHQGRVRSDSRLPDGHSPCHPGRIAFEFLIGKNARHVLAPFST